MNKYLYNNKFTIYKTILIFYNLRYIILVPFNIIFKLLGILILNILISHIIFTVKYKT
jgi:hypothetical protein